MCPTFPPLLPLPRLTLKLSNATILDTILLDARDATPLFTIETVANQTALYHTDSAANGRLSHVAAVHWPASHQKHQKKEKDATVFINSQTVPSSAFLKKTVLGGSRKFHVPGQSHPLKWKHVGSHWECTLCSHACTAHRAVATFEPAHTTSAAHLNVYADTVVSSRTYAETGIHAQYDGVDMDMLAYLVLTSMLLTTQPHAWQDLNIRPLTEKYIPRQVVVVHQPSPVITSTSPSTSSYKASPRIDLLSDDLSHSPIRGSPTSQSSSCYSSLPPSPLTPSMDLSPIHHDTFASFAPSPSSTHSNNGCTGTGTGMGTSTPTSVFRRNSRNSNRMPSPLITCSTFSNSSSSSSPTTATPNTPAGPSAITPYHLPPAPCSSTPSTPHSLHPHHSHALPHHSHSSTHHSHHHHHHHHNHTQQQQRSHTNNALHLDTSHATVVASPVLPYTTQIYNIQFAGEAPPPPPPVANDELPPAYNEIEWTIRVKQPRNGGPRPLRVQ